MDKGKRRRLFYLLKLEPSLYAQGERLFSKTVLAKGVLYDEGNVQVLWREDVGWTAEQYANIGQLFGMFEGAYVIEVLGEV